MIITAELLRLHGFKNNTVITGFAKINNTVAHDKGPFKKCVTPEGGRRGSDGV